MAIFDMDETLVHSDHIWLDSVSSLLEDSGFAVDSSIHDIFYDRGFSAVIAHLIENYFPSLSKPELFSILSERSIPGYWTKATLVPGAVELVDAVKSLGCFTCVLSANRRPLMEAVSSRYPLAIDKWFTASELGMAKSDAHIFDLIAGYFGLEPSQAALFDDAEYALEGARSAGMKIIRVHSAKEEKRYRLECPTLMSLSDFKEDML